MKAVIAMLIGLFFYSTLPAQTLAKKNQNRITDNHSLIISNRDFKTYITNANIRLEEVNASLSMLRLIALNQENTNRKVNTKVNSLVKESVELKNDLNNYLQYGIGDWQLFRNEFNDDLSCLITDIHRLNTYFESMNLFAEK